MNSGRTPRPCPFCAVEIADGARTCPSCGETVLQTCPFCAEEILALTRICGWCKSDLASPTGEAKRAPTPEESRRANSLGEERGLTVVILLGLVTCGVYAFYAMHEQMKEIKAHHPGGRALDPTRDLVLCILTHFATVGLFPFWIYYVMYQYPRAFQESCAQEEFPCRDVLTPCVLLAVLSASLLCLSLAIPVWIFAVALLQNELNHHWRLHRQLGPVAA